MNSGFFATADGVKVIEFNARFGDPECMNIMSLFEGSWTEVMRQISEAQLTPADVPLREEASLVLYLVSPDYALRKGPPYEFTLDRERIEAEGCHVFFSSAVASRREQLPHGRHLPGGGAGDAPRRRSEQARERVVEVRRDRAGARVAPGGRRRTLSAGPAPSGRDLRACSRGSCKDASMIVEHPHPQFVSNTYLVADGDGGPAFFVDAGGPVEPLIEAAERLGSRPLARAAHPPPLRPRQRDRPSCANAGPACGC